MDFPCLHPYSQRPANVSGGSSAGLSGGVGLFAYLQGAKSCCLPTGAIAYCLPTGATVFCLPIRRLSRRQGRGAIVLSPIPYPRLLLLGRDGPTLPQHDTCPFHMRPRLQILYFLDVTPGRRRPPCPSPGVLQRHRVPDDALRTAPRVGAKAERRRRKKKTPSHGLTYGIENRGSTEEG